MKDGQRMVTIRLNDDQHTQLVRRAADAKLSVNQFCLREFGFEIEPQATVKGKTSEKLTGERKKR